MDASRIWVNGQYNIKQCAQFHIQCNNKTFTHMFLDETQVTELPGIHSHMPTRDISLNVQVKYILPYHTIQHLRSL